MKPKTLVFILAIALPLLVGGIAGTVTVSEIGSWYAGLNKPFFNPPSWLFGPVWTTLYLLMGYASYRIAMLPASVLRKKALIGYGIQLLWNFLWSLLFFGAHSPAWALIDIVALDITLWLCMRQFYRLDRTAGWLLVPYIMWVSFASVLNAAILYLNP